MLDKLRLLAELELKKIENNGPLNVLIARTRHFQT